MTSSSSSWCFLRCFPLLHYIFLGVQMSLERERCADVLINLPLLTSVTKLLTLSKLLCRSEILWNIQTTWSKRVQMLRSLWLLIGNGQWTCLIMKDTCMLNFTSSFWDSGHKKVYFSAYGDPVLVEAGCGKFPRYLSLAHIRLKFHDIVPKLSSLAVTQSKLAEVTNSR